MAKSGDRDQRPSEKGPAIVRLAGWIILAISLIGRNLIGVVAGVLMLRYADRIAGKIAATPKLSVIGRDAGAPVEGGMPGRDAAEKVRGEEEFLIACPFCRKMNKPNTGKCRSCGYAM
jgi:hypothetical protein